MNCLTINTDASFHKIGKDKIASGYAFWIICDRFRIQHSANFRRTPKTPTEAEVMCIANAIATILQRPLSEIKVVVINTDCLYASGVEHRQNKGVDLKLEKLLAELKEKTDCVIEFRHVVAHTQNPDARSYVNRWCDLAAKKHMRLQRKKLLNL